MLPEKNRRNEKYAIMNRCCPYSILPTSAFQMQCNLAGALRMKMREQQVSCLFLYNESDTKVNGEGLPTSLWQRNIVHSASSFLHSMSHIQKANQTLYYEKKKLEVNRNPNSAIYVFKGVVPLTRTRDKAVENIVQQNHLQHCISHTLY